MGKNQKKKNGRPSKYNSLTYEDISLVRWLASQGATQAEIAAHFKVNERTFQRWRSKTGHIAISLNSAIVVGQYLYGKPTASLTLCLLEELDRWDVEWKQNVGIKHDLNIHSYNSEEDIQKLASAQLHCFGLKSGSPEECNAWGMLYELSDIQKALRNVDQVTHQLSNTTSWDRYSNKEPLRWDLLQTLHKRFISREKKISQDRVDKTSQSVDLKDTD